MAWRNMVFQRMPATRLDTIEEVLAEQAKTTFQDIRNPEVVFLLGATAQALMDEGEQPYFADQYPMINSDYIS